MVKNMEKGFSTIKVEENIRVTGLMIRSMVLESLNMPMEIAMKAPGEMDNAPTMEYTNIRMAMFMMESGATIQKRGTEGWIWRLAISIKEIGKLAKKMAKVFLCQIQVSIFLQMVTFTKDSFKMVTDREREPTHGLIKAIIEVSGQLTR